MTNKGMSTRYPEFRKAKTNLLARIQRIKSDTERLLPELAPISDQQLIHLLAASRRFHEGSLHFGRRGISANRFRLRELTISEKVVYDYLRKEWKESPSTVYRWALSMRLPSDIKAELEAGKLGQIRALKLAQNRLDRRKDGQAMVVIDMVAQSVQNMLN